MGIEEKMIPEALKALVGRTAQGVSPRDPATVKPSRHTHLGVKIYNNSNHILNQGNILN